MSCVFLKIETLVAAALHRSQCHVYYSCLRGVLDNVHSVLNKFRLRDWPNSSVTKSVTERTRVCGAILRGQKQRQ